LSLKDLHISEQRRQIVEALYELHDPRVHSILAKRGAKIQEEEDEKGEESKGNKSKNRKRKRTKKEKKPQKISKKP
jgi:hypothetical protein